MAIALYNDELKVKHVLKADSFGQIITVYNKENNKVRSLVEDPKDFFDHIYVDANGSLEVNGVHYNHLSIDQWFKDNNNFSEALNCLLFLVEGYAGCGKSTLVQHILYEILGNLNYGYSYYNYDIGSYPDNSTDDKIDSVQLIKYSILHGLKKQILTICRTREGKTVFNKFLMLMDDEDALAKLDATIKIKTSFGASRGFIASVEQLFNSERSSIDSAMTELEGVINAQLNMLTTYQMLCVDYLWRLAQYLSKPREYRKYMYVCYDNLDSIMNIDVLCNFKDELVIFREILNEYISQLNRNITLQDKIYGENISRIESFVIFATYRKITAIRSDNRNTEMLEDMIAGNEYIRLVEVSKQYDFADIAQKRINHFSAKFRTTDICGRRSAGLIRQMNKIKEVRKMNFVKSTYAGLWNNNFRACSNVLGELIEHDNTEIDTCIELYKKKVDGYSLDRCCYYGASSLFLHAICKMLKRMEIFDSRHLDLINIKEDALIRNTSLSRLIITYLYTKGDSVSIIDLFRDFDKVFEPQYICKILGQLIKRVKGEVWRRPIYYSKYALDNENDIQNKLFYQYQKYIDEEPYNFVEFKICDCGETYINSIVPQFEFYSVRINEEYPNLYNIEDEFRLEEVLKSVYEKIEICCKKQIEFAQNYIEKYNLDINQYLELPFHPRTHYGNPQLHIERVIFSHTEYFNKFRMYLMEKNNPKKYDKFNDILLNYIKKYIALYNNYISKICTDRKEIAGKLQKKLQIANKSYKYISIEV